MKWKPPTSKPLKGIKPMAADPSDPTLTTEADLENWFTYHRPREGQSDRYEMIRAQGLVMARVIFELTPPGPDQTAAIRKVREAVFTACAAIACEHEVQSAYYMRKVQK
jgi:hypothetical protein